MMAQSADTFAFDASEIAEIFTSVFSGILIGIEKSIAVPPFWEPISSTMRNAGTEIPACDFARSVTWQKWFPVDPLEACQCEMYPLYPAGVV